MQGKPSVNNLAGSGYIGTNENGQFIWLYKNGEAAVKLGEKNAQGKEIIRIYDTDANRNLTAKIDTAIIEEKDVKQNDNWIKKRVLKISKPVIKINLINNIILERFESLADAGKNNVDFLSYEQILRKCLGYSKNDDNNYWCYENDYINNNFKQYKAKHYKQLNEFTKNELLNIYNEYKQNQTSIRELSKKHLINFSTLNQYIKIIEMPIINDFNKINKYVAICKKTNKKFSDYLNKSGILTMHITNIYPEIKLESKFKRKQVEIKTGKPWYYDYFVFKIV